jgi:hypothetical protein
LLVLYVAGFLVLTVLFVGRLGTAPHAALDAVRTAPVAPEGGAAAAEVQGRSAGPALAP